MADLYLNPKKKIEQPTPVRLADGRVIQVFGQNSAPKSIARPIQPVSNIQKGPSLQQSIQQSTYQRPSVQAKQPGLVTAVGGLGKSIVSGLQQTAGNLGDIALMGGNVLEDTAAAIRGDSAQDRNKIFQRYESLREGIKGAKTVTGESYNPNKDYASTGNLGRDIAQVAGRGLQTGLDATMFANPASALGGTLRSQGVRGTATAIGKEAATFGGADALAGGVQTYGETGDIKKAAQTAALRGGVTALTSGALNVTGAGANKALKTASTTLGNRFNQTERKVVNIAEDAGGAARSNREARTQAAIDNSDPRTSYAPLENKIHPIAESYVRTNTRPSVTAAKQVVPTSITRKPLVAATNASTTPNTVNLANNPVVQARLRQDLIEAEQQVQRPVVSAKNKQAAPLREATNDVQLPDELQTQGKQVEKMVEINGKQVPLAGFEKGIQKYMKQNNATREEAEQAVPAIFAKSIGNAPSTELPRNITPSTYDIKAALQDLSNARNAGDVQARLSSNLIGNTAKRAGVSVDQNFIDRYQAGTELTPQESEVANAIKAETDRIYSQQKAINPDVEYRSNYVPQSYTQGGEEVTDSVNRFRNDTNSSRERTFDTYAEAAEYGLTPKYESLDQMIGVNAREATQALKQGEVVENGLASGLFDTVDGPGKRAVEGFKAPDGSPLYATKKDADMINRVFQDSGTELAKLFKAGKKINSTWQDIALSGGIPFTPLNAFTFAQVVKDATAGRLSVAKDILYSFSGQATQKRFANNSGFVTKMAERGVPFNLKSNVENIDKNGLQKLWGEAVNRPTFEQFMPNQYLTVAENTYKAAKRGGKAEAEALDLAAQTTRNYFGIIDRIAKGRSQEMNDAIGTFFFAPQYREAIVNTLLNTGKSLNPATFGDRSLDLNRRLFAGMAISLVGYELLNQQLTGHSMLDNRSGQELTIEVPVGEKDEKGDQKVINIPFMPSFLTVPRSIIQTGLSLLEGDSQQATKYASSNLSMPLQTAGAIIGNQDYFSKPIYNDQKVADTEGINPDSPATAAGKVGLYLAKQSTPGPVRGLIDYATGKPPEQVAAQVLEAPVRFGKNLNDNTESFFAKKEQIYKILSPQEKKAFDAAFPSSKDRNEEDTLYDSSVKAGLFKKYPNVLKAANELNNRPGNTPDPFYALDPQSQQTIITLNTLSDDPGNESTKQIRKDNPWLSDYYKGRGEYFASLPGGNKDETGLPKPPAASPQLQSKLDQYSSLSSGKSRYLKDNPDVANYFSASHEYQNTKRAMLGLPLLDDYGNIAGDSNSSGSSSGRSYASSNRGTSNGSSKGVGAVNERKYAISLNAGGEIAKPTVKARAGSKTPRKYVARKSTSALPKVTSKKSLV